MEPILKIIAREYSQRFSNLKDLCFLFPNKRCITFLKKYFLEYGITTEDFPHILTISELVSQVARRTEAGKIEQLFALYKSYEKISCDKDNSTADFETFRNWGETVLSDFNTIDLNMADPEEIFKNVKDYREITSNFLTDEQKEVMREYFGVEDYSDSGEFWKNFYKNDSLSDLQQGFLSIWQILAPLHKDFLDRLEEKGLGTTGSIYRRAAEQIISKGKEALPYKKIIIVGFNALTESERRIFKELKDAEGYPGFDTYSDFIWDAAGPLLNSKELTASRFVNYNRKHFPCPEWLGKITSEQEKSAYPDIEIISAPSSSSQTKVVAEILKGYKNEDKKRIISDSEVAVVLPDETLLSNLLYSIPDEIEEINLTMGVSLRYSSVSSFMTLLRRAYVRLRETKEDKVFYTKDLKVLFTHPYVYMLFDSGCVESFLKYLSDNHKVSVKLKEMEEYLPGVEEILNYPSKNAEETEVFVFVKNILKRLIEKIGESPDKEEENPDLSEIRIYLEYVESLEEVLRQYSVKMSALTLLQIIERLVASEKVGFEGEPLRGLQVMGTLETRSLDFRHLIILSMNEGVMPRKATSPTFIPESLRRAYGLPPARYAEEIFGYYFYRLISRAEKVTLIYDGRTTSGLRGGVSRYLLQLREYAPKDKIKEQSWQYLLQPHEYQDVSVNKTEEIRNLMEAYQNPGEGRKNLSASSLNSYRECEMRFFLQSLLNINSDPERSEYMDAITVGNILHEVMMDLYMPEKYHRQLLSDPILMTRESLESILGAPELIKAKIKKNVSKYYYGDPEGKKDISSGVNELISQQIEQLVRDIINYDVSLTPFRLYGCEISRNIQVKMSNGRNVNFRFAIDRLDEIEIEGEPRLRIVDYKTGGRKRAAEDLQSMFEGGYKSEQIFQLFTYAWLLGKIGVKGWEDVVTEIYYVPDLINGEGGLPVVGKEKVTSFRPYIEEFNERMEAMVESIFSSPRFEMSKNPSDCRYCVYNTFCLK